MVFTATCRGCYLLSLLMQELKISSAALHSHLTQNRRLAALEKCALLQLDPQSCCAILSQ